MSTEYNGNYPISLYGLEQTSEINLILSFQISEKSIKNISAWYLSINFAWFYSLPYSKGSFFPAK